MDDRLEQIREHWGSRPESRWVHERDELRRLAGDMAWLLDEVDRLRAERDAWLDDHLPTLPDSVVKRYRLPEVPAEYEVYGDGHVYGRPE